MLVRILRLVVVVVLITVVADLKQRRPVDAATARPRRILMDTDANMDDIFALFYVLKQNRSEFDLQVSPYVYIYNSCVIVRIWKQYNFSEIAFFLETMKIAQQLTVFSQFLFGAFENMKAKMTLIA